MRCIPTTLMHSYMKSVYLIRRTLVTDVYSAYITFCVNRGTRPVELVEFGRRLGKKGILNHRHEFYGESLHYYDGVWLCKELRDKGQGIL
jgi:hypothetical protein